MIRDNRPRVCGLDLSLQQTGYATPDGDHGLIRPSSRSGIERLAWIRNQVMKIEHDHRVELFAIEGYSYGSKGRAVFNIGELGGVIRTALWDAGVPYVDVPPATLKKYACGKGNANKDLVRDAARDRMGLTAGVSNDECDAVWLRALVLEALGCPVVEVPKTHRAALDALNFEEAA